MASEDKMKIATETYTLLYLGEKASSHTVKAKKGSFQGKY